MFCSHKQSSALISIWTAWTSQKLLQSRSLQDRHSASIACLLPVQEKAYASSRSATLPSYGYCSISNTGRSLHCMALDDRSFLQSPIKFIWHSTNLLTLRSPDRKLAELEGLSDTMVKPTEPPANGFVRVMRQLYNPLGFSKGYNFVFWFITMGSISLCVQTFVAKYALLTFPDTFLASHWLACNTSLTTASSATPKCTA